MNDSCNISCGSAFTTSSSGLRPSLKIRGVQLNSKQEVSFVVEYNSDDSDQLRRMEGKIIGNCEPILPLFIRDSCDTFIMLQIIACKNFAFACIFCLMYAYFQLSKLC